MTPVADAFVNDHHTTGRQDQVDLAQAEAEAMLKPNRMLDDLGREAKAAVGIGRGRHVE
jgi:hypothetical protein